MQKGTDFQSFWQDEDADELDNADMAEEDGEEEAEEKDSTRNNLELVLGLVHQMTFKALIRQEDVDSERNVVLNGVCVVCVCGVCVVCVFVLCVCVVCVCVCMCAYVYV
jgi:hypothetical protein